MKRKKSSENMQFAFTKDELLCLEPKHLDICVYYKPCYTPIAAYHYDWKRLKKNYPLVLPKFGQIEYYCSLREIVPTHQTEN